MLRVTNWCICSGLVWLLAESAGAQSCVLRDYTCTSLGPGSSFCTGSVKVCDNCYRGANPGETGRIAGTGGVTEAIYCKTYAPEDVYKYLCTQGAPGGTTTFCTEELNCCAIAAGATPTVIEANGNCRVPPLGANCTG